MKLDDFGAFNDGRYPATMNGSKVKSYRHWHQMLRRVFDSEYRKPYHTTYDDVDVCEDFLSYSKFHEWCESTKGYWDSDFHLDKDIKNKGCKIYSPETCIFVPKELNQVFVNRTNFRGEYPVGVYAYNGRYRCQVQMFGKRKIWEFDTVREAFLKYKLEKESHIKIIADKYKLRMDVDAYQACINYVIEEED